MLLKQRSLKVLDSGGRPNPHVLVNTRLVIGLVAFGLALFTQACAGGGAPPQIPERVPLVDDPDYVKSVLGCYRLNIGSDELDFGMSDPKSEDCLKIATTSSERCSGGDSVYCREADSHLSSFNCEDSKEAHPSCLNLVERERTCGGPIGDDDVAQMEWVDCKKKWAQWYEEQCSSVEEEGASCEWMVQAIALYMELCTTPRYSSFCGELFRLERLSGSTAEHRWPLLAEVLKQTKTICEGSAGQGDATHEGALEQFKLNLIAASQKHRMKEGDRSPRVLQDRWPIPSSVLSDVCRPGWLTIPPEHRGRVETKAYVSAAIESHLRLCSSDAPIVHPVNGEDLRPWGCRAVELWIDSEREHLGSDNADPEYAGKLDAYLAQRQKVASDEVSDVLSHARHVCEAFTRADGQATSKSDKQQRIAELATSKKYLSEDADCYSSQYQHLVKTMPEAAIPCLCKPGALLLPEGGANESEVRDFLLAAVEAHLSLCSSRKLDLKKQQASACETLQAWIPRLLGEPNKASQADKHSVRLKEALIKARKHSWGPILSEFVAQDARRPMRYIWDLSAIDTFWRVAPERQLNEHDLKPFTTMFKPFVEKLVRDCSSRNTVACEWHVALDKWGGAFDAEAKKLRATEIEYRAANCNAEDWFGVRYDSERCWWPAKWPETLTQLVGNRKQDTPYGYANCDSRERAVHRLLDCARVEQLKGMK